MTRSCLRRRLLHGIPALAAAVLLAGLPAPARADSIEVADVRLEPSFEGDAWAL